MMKEYYISYDGIRLHAKLEMPENTDRCPLAIVIHGVTGDMEEEHITAVCETMRHLGVATLRVDMYGHGKSDGSFRNHTLFDWIKGALAVLDHVQKMDFVTELLLCGHSQGGLLVMLIAGMFPDRIKAVIPLSPAWMIPEGARKGRMIGADFDPEHIPDEIHIRNGYILNGNYARVAQTIYPETLMRKYKGPVLIIHGDADETVPVSYAYDASEIYADCRLALIPGDTHCYDHHLDMVTDAVSQFIRYILGLQD